MTDVINKVWTDAQPPPNESKHKLWLDAVLDNTLLSIMALTAIRDDDGNIYDFEYVFINKKAEESVNRFGITGKRLLKEFPGARESWLFGHYVQVTETGIPWKDEVFYNFDGYECWSLAKVTKLEDGCLVMYEDITEKKKAERAKAEEALRKSEEKYRTLFETIDEGFAILELIFDDNGNVADFIYKETNPAFFKHVGMDLRGKRRSELDLDKKDSLLEKYNHLVKTGEPLHFDHNVKGLRDQWFRVTATRIGGEGSNYLGVVFSNITERKHREQLQVFLLKLSDALRTVYDPLEIQQAAMQVVGEFLQVDYAFYNEVRENGEIIHIEDNYTRGNFPKITGDFPVRQFGAAMEVLRSGEVLVIDDQTTTPLKKPSEQQASTGMGVFASAIVPLIKEGRWIANFAVHQRTPRKWKENEITILRETAERTWAAVERAKAEEALLRSEQKYRTLFNSIEEGFCIIEMLYDKTGEVVDYRFLETNPAFELQTGLKNVVNKTGKEVLDRTEPYWLKEYGRVAKTGESVRLENYHEATNRWYLVYASKISDKPWVAILFDDITERKQTEAQLKELNESLIVRRKEAETAYRKEKKVNDELRRMNQVMDTFVYSAAHDLKAPVSNLKLLTDAIENSDNIEIKERLQHKYPAVIKTLDQTISGLISVLAIEKDPEVIKPLKLQDVYNDVMAELATKVLEADPEITTDFAQCTSVTYIESYLMSIFRNMITNALKYRSDGKKLVLKISSKREDCHVLLTFSDNGIGIDLEIYGGDLFKPFKRFSGQSEGSGIGLHLIHSMVTKNRGKIEVESQPGKGTTFRVYLIEYKK